MTAELSTDVNLALLLLRVTLGLMMASHGYAKFFLGGKIDGTAGWFDAIGMRPGRIHALLAASTELVAGLLLAVGLLHSFAAAGIVGVMVVAYWVDHRDKGFFILKQGWEYVFIISVAVTALAILGPGAWSFDHALGWADDLNGWVGLVLAAGLGIGAGATEVALFFRPPAPVAE